MSQYLHVQLFIAIIFLVKNITAQSINGVVNNANTNKPVARVLIQKNGEVSCTNSSISGSF